MKTKMSFRVEQIKISRRAGLEAIYPSRIQERTRKSKSATTQRITWLVERVWDGCGSAQRDKDLQFNISAGWVVVTFSSPREKLYTEPPSLCLSVGHPFYRFSLGRPVERRLCTQSCSLPPSFSLPPSLSLSLCPFYSRGEDYRARIPRKICFGLMGPFRRVNALVRLENARARATIRKNRNGSFSRREGEGRKRKREEKRAGRHGLLEARGYKVARGRIHGQWRNRVVEPTNKTEIQPYGFEESKLLAGRLQVLGDLDAPGGVEYSGKFILLLVELFARGELLLVPCSLFAFIFG